MRRPFALPLLLLLAAVAGWMAYLPAPARAQSQPITGVTFSTAAVRTGPGDTFAELGLIPTYTQVELLERNGIGNWVYVRDETDTLTGWTLTGYLVLEDVALSRVPVNPTVPDADLTALEESLVADLYAMPIIPQLSPAMREVFALGQSLGNRADTLIRIGDCNTASSLFLTPIPDGNYDLGPYDFLQATADAFSDSFSLESPAAQAGFNVASLFDPFWADNTICEIGESSLDCAYRLYQPAFALVMFGQNDIEVLTARQYERWMRRTITDSLDAGIIPILTTFTSQPQDGRRFATAVAFNRVTVALAQEYEVPLLNFWSAARALPGYGLLDDNIHLSANGRRLDLSLGQEAFYGVSLYNLLVLRTLDELVRELEIEIEA